jgi:hypothetical protein
VRGLVSVGEHEGVWGMISLLLSVSSRRLIYGPTRVVHRNGVIALMSCDVVLEDEGFVNSQVDGGV